MLICLLEKASQLGEIPGHISGPLIMLKVGALGMRMIINYSSQRYMFSICPIIPSTIQVNNPKVRRTGHDQ